MSEEIQVLYVVNDTTKTDTFTAENTSTTMGPDSTVIDLTGGRHNGRPVLSVLYADAQRVIRYGDGGSGT